MKGGTGTTPSCADSWGKVGGGILVARAESAKWAAQVASLEFRSGTIENNTADAGGGIFIDYHCGFTMTGGIVQNNVASTHEGGGIFVYGNWNGKTGTASTSYCHITGGTIKNNRTETKTDWGGGGVYSIQTVLFASIQPLSPTIPLKASAAASPAVLMQRSALVN